MSKFWTKLRICIADPRKLGFFMGEKKWKSLVQLFLFLILALTPYLIRLNVENEISSSSKEYLKTILMTEEIDYNIAISEGRLVGDGSLSIILDECIVFINPLNQILDNSNYEYLPVFEFRENGIVVSLMGNIFGDYTYSELGYLNLNFNEIFDSNFIEFNVFIALLNDLYGNSMGYTNTISFITTLVTNYILIIFSALVIALLGGMANKLVSYKFRFKGALDAQFISIVFIFLSHLFNILYLDLIGVFLSIIYFTRGVMSIVRIEIRKIKKED
jgi:hypothetical protein